MTDPRARAAAVYVCAHALDATDARLLLDALGLLADGTLTMPNPGALPVRTIRNVAASGGIHQRSYYQ